MLAKEVKEMEEKMNNKQVANFAKSLACINGGNLTVEADQLLVDCVEGKRTTEEALQLLINKYSA